MADYTDDFNRADAALTTPWSVITSENNFTITGNNVEPVTLGSDSAVRYGNTFADNQYSQFTLITLTGGSSGSDAGIGPALRAASGARTYYRILINAAATNNTFIAKMVGGSYTILSGSDDTVAWAASDVVRGEAEGTTIRLKRNGGEVLSVTDASIASGQAGLTYSSTITAADIDDWGGGDLVASAGASRSSSRVTLMGMGR